MSFEEPREYVTLPRIQRDPGKCLDKLDLVMRYAGRVLSGCDRQRVIGDVVFAQGARTETERPVTFPIIGTAPTSIRTSTVDHGVDTLAAHTPRTTDVR
jgi:hypothetical protein